MFGRPGAIYHLHLAEAEAQLRRLERLEKEAARAPSIPKMLAAAAAGLVFAGLVGVSIAGG